MFMLHLHSLTQYFVLKAYNATAKHLQFRILNQLFEFKQFMVQLVFIVQREEAFRRDVLSNLLTHEFLLLEYQEVDNID